MMYWWGDQMSGWGWVLMTFSSLIFWALLITAIVALIRYTRTAGGGQVGPSAPLTPEQVLADRYARGDIDDAEYQRRLDTLAGAARAGAPQAG